MKKSYGELAISFLSEILECLDSDSIYMERFIKMMMEYNEQTRGQVLRVIQEYRNAVELSSVDKK